jgi:alkylation response protein AidB-like acyl-CoA dehydrogenase
MAGVPSGAATARTDQDETRPDPPPWRQLQEQVRAIAADFAASRPERQRRRTLDPADFERLRQAGFPLIGVPAELGGLWAGRQRSIRPICELLRTLAQGDPSVALVAAMHVPVLGTWLCIAEAPASFDAAWQVQRRQVFQTVLDGAWWGTIISEPGSGGDPNQSVSAARPGPAPGSYLISGQKHFGSGSGIASFMTTVAVPAGESAPVSFFMDLRGVPWDGSAGVTLTAPWDGHGMTATQSHAMRFENFPATRTAWQGSRNEAQAVTRGIPECSFTAVVVGVVESAFAEVRRQLGPRAGRLRAYERVEWARAEIDEWLIHQAYEGMLRESERAAVRPAEVLKGKTAVAELAEASLGRLCRVVGGSAYSRRGPLGFWLQDVRALGFLRPPWGLAFERLIEASFPPQ